MTKEEGVNTDLLSFLTKHSKKITIFLVLFCMITIAAAGITYWQYKEADTKNNGDTVTGQVDLSDSAISQAKKMSTVSGKIESIDASTLVIIANGNSKTFKVNDATEYTKGPSLDKSSRASLPVGNSVSVGYDSSTMTALNVWYEG